jgi:dolichol-phosphate mannosyltransferase
MISVVIPCYNEQEVLDALYRRLSAAAESWNEDYEVVLVDDGSVDDTWSIIREIHERDPRWRAVRFTRNFGHQTAVSAGLRHTRGDCVIVMDADLQDPPEELIRFIDRWREGYEVIYAIRRKRKEGILKKVAYKGFYRILGMLSSVTIPYDSGDFCVLDRKVVDVLNTMPEHNRFVRGLRAWAGFRQVGVPYERDARAAGEVKYTASKLIRLAIDGIFSFSTTPLRVATYLGLFVSFLCVLGVLVHLVQRIFADWFTSIGHGPPPGFSTTVVGIFFLGGVQLICLGVIGEYIGRIYDEVKGRPLWLTSEVLGDEADEPARDSGGRSGFSRE